jgi:hypothetical protein
MFDLPVNGLTRKQCCKVATRWTHLSMFCLQVVDMRSEDDMERKKKLLSEKWAMDGSYT